MKNATYIALINDRSGSIEGVLPQMQAAVTEFISAQKHLEGECELLIAEFDDEYDIVYKGSIADAPSYKIHPRGGTALLDAVGRTINEVGAELAARDEADRPDKVMFVIITDGFENASRNFTQTAIREMITHQTEKYSWNFDFLGANQDAILVGEELGVLAANAMSFCTSSAGTRSVSASLSNKASMFRSEGVYKSYDMADRTAAMATDEEDASPIFDAFNHPVQNDDPFSSGIVSTTNPPAVVKHPSSVEKLLKNAKAKLGGGKKTTRIRSRSTKA